MKKRKPWNEPRTDLLATIRRGDRPVLRCTENMIGKGLLMAWLDDPDCCIDHLAVFRSLERCEDTLEYHARRSLRMPRGTTYSDAVRRLRKEVA